jgi:four helix bundle protein
MEEKERNKKQIRNYKDLDAWKTGCELTKLIYQVTRQFPKEEMFGLTSQLRRSAVSVPSNIAEGYGRGARSEYARFLKISRGSLNELETQLIISEQLEFLSADQMKNILDILQKSFRILQGLINSVEK